MGFNDITWTVAHFFIYVLESKVFEYFLMLALVVFVFDIIVEVFNHEKD